VLSVLLIEIHESLRIELALRLCEKSIASLGQARRIAGPLEVGLPRTVG